MLGADSQSPSILGIEVGATVVRAVVLSTDSLEVTAAAEAGIDTFDEHVFDSTTIRPALGEVMYQLAELAPESMMAAISIGPPQSGVGSGPALPPWLERQARNLGQNLICAGELGVAFCPQTPVDLLISLCEEAAITVARVDLAPVAAARLLMPGGADTIMVGSGRGWRARLRNNEVLEALHTDEIDIDQPMSIVRPDGRVTEIPKYHGVGVAPALDEEFELNLGQLAPAVGAAVGLIDNSPTNLLNGATVVGRAVPVTSEHHFGHLAGFVNEPGDGGVSSGSAVATAGGDSGFDPSSSAGAEPELISDPGVDVQAGVVETDVLDASGEHQAVSGQYPAVSGEHGAVDLNGGLSADDFADDFEVAAPIGDFDPGGAGGAATGQHNFDVDDLAPLQPDDGGPDPSPAYGFASNQFVPGSGGERTTVDLAHVPSPAVPADGGAFDDSPMVIDRQPGRSPRGTTTGDFDDITPVGESEGSSFPIMLVVLVVLIVAVAIFILTR